MPIRAATPVDGPAVAAVRVAALRHAYGELLDPLELEELDANEDAPRWSAVLGEPGVVGRVTEVGGRVVGVAIARTGATDGPGSRSGADGSPRPVADPDAAEVLLLHVHPVAHGAGLGTALLAAVEQALRDAGADRASLRVDPGNWWTARFLGGRGWSRDGDGPAATFERDLTA